MKSLINFSLRNKFAIWLLTIIIVFAGLYSGLTMKQETLPNISIPYLSVTTIYPGAAPEGVVNDVSKPLEQKLRNVDGVKTITSTSLENASSIQIEFDYGTNLDNATAAVREALNEVSLPDNVQKPSISRFSLSSMPVVSLSLSNGDSEDLEELTRIAENDIRPALEDVEGVASIQISGQYVKEVSLKFNQEKLKEYGLTEDTVKGIIQGSSLRVPLGLFEMDKAQKAVVVDGNITTVEDLKNVTIPVMPTGAASAAGAGAPGAGAAGAGAAGGAANMGLPTVKLGELATIEVVGNSESISRTNGKESIGIQIVKANDANTVDVVNGVKDKTEELKAQYKGIDLTVLLDQGKPIEDSVNTMLSKAVFGALFAVIIILVFLRNIRSTIISIISIPLSLLIAVLCLRQMDITLNMMTLGAMTVAIGRVVDDSIVVIENIYRRLSLSGEKLKGRELISAATREMFVPIMSSTIVTIAVFLPLALVSGMVGELFLPFALTMVFALLASLVVAITLVPAMAHSLFRNGLKGKKTHSEKPDRMSAGYQKILNWCLSHKLVTFGVAVLLLAGSLFLIKPIGVSFMPSQEDKTVMLTYSPKAGQRTEEVQEQGLKAEKYILAQQHVDKMQYSIGGGGPMGMGGSSNSGLFFIVYDSKTPDFESVKEKLIEGLTAEVPDGVWGDMSAMMSGGMGGSSLTVNVFGDDLDQIKPVADEIAKIVQADTTNFKDGETSLKEAYDQYTIVADQEKLSSLGLTAGQIAMKLAPAGTRPVLTEVEMDGKNYKVYIETDKETYKSIKEMEEATLTSPLGISVPIGQVAKIENGSSPDSITRMDGKMKVDVTAEIISSDVNSASNLVKEKVDAMDLPDGVTVSFGGVTEQINDTFGQLGIAMAAAIAIVYFVLVVTFGGGLAPFAILFSLPFTIIGVLVALLIAGETLNVSSLMGALMLIGIVVTNAIVLIDRVIHKEKEGMTTRQALLEAGGTRLRPILMTALATIGALLPLVTGLENSAGIISKGLGVTVIGGLISSTLLTLVVVPVVYEFLMKFRSKKVID
ncbi:Swarming motility protein SwrC [Paenibacillus sp. VTT E-133280]|jgi:multidrug efflux pump subunit AcrB|uniref:efflux RND transporter permease subunit n=1 Tax=Paenibacillus TaxID=44249 RepID=UPI000BA0B4E6|nr:efflux RND transporter permease subunit [Paenibacillus sp. VTT E-133280]OZQ64930.1 Swarming motility protein SwrC [Paenibacillus sp. VTT E-133280]